MMPIFSAQELLSAGYNFSPPSYQEEFLNYDTNYSEKIVQASSIYEYDLGVDGDLFNAPEPIIEQSVLTGSLSLLTNEAMMVTDSDNLLNEVFYNCERELLEKFVIFESAEEPSEVKDTKEDNVNINILDSATNSCLLNDVLEQSKVLVSNSRESDFQVEEFLCVNNDISVIDGAFQKCVSLGSLSTVDCANNSTVGSNFVDARGPNMECEYGIRRAQSEGDIQTLGNIDVLSSVLKHFPKTGVINIEERRQKLIRYKKKKASRNFNRKIKYACRKALAESQPRIRGRFAKTEGTRVKVTKLKNCKSDQMNVASVASCDEIEQK